MQYLSCILAVGAGYVLFIISKSNYCLNVFTSPLGVIQSNGETLHRKGKSLGYIEACDHITELKEMKHL